MKKNLLITLILVTNVLLVFSQDCITIDHAELAKDINNFRTTNNKQKLQLSFTMCSAANQMAITLQDGTEKPYLSQGVYLSKHKMINMKVRGINANSKNTIGTFTMRHPALDMWKVILEEDAFSGSDWKSIGVGLYKNYAVLWFSDKALNDNPEVCGGQKLDTETEIIISNTKKLPEIDNGKWIVAPSYYRMRKLNAEAELFPAADDSDKWGYINKNGKVVIPFQYSNAYGFSHGLAAVMVDSKYGYINNTGELKIKPKYSYGGSFKNGLAIVSSDNANYLINTTGEIVSEKYTDMAWLNDKYLACKNGWFYDIKDLSGKVIKKGFFNDFFSYSEGLAGIKVTGKWGFMDEDFNIAIKPEFTEKLVYAFHSGLARFKQHGKVGVIDKTSRIILPARYENLYEFNEDLAAFMENGKWGYINSQGETIIEAKYTSAENFRFGMAKVEDNELQVCLINRNNELILSGMRDIFIISNKLVAAKTKNGWGLIQLD